MIFMPVSISNNVMELCKAALVSWKFTTAVVRRPRSRDNSIIDIFPFTKSASEILICALYRATASDLTFNKVKCSNTEL